jgi:hypothetical protein
MDVVLDFGHRETVGIRSGEIVSIEPYLLPSPRVIFESSGRMTPGGPAYRKVTSWNAFAS